MVLVGAPLQNGRYLFLLCADATSIHNVKSCFGCGQRVVQRFGTSTRSICYQNKTLPGSRPVVRAFNRNNSALHVPQQPTAGLFKKNWFSSSGRPGKPRGGKTGRGNREAARAKRGAKTTRKEEKRAAASTTSKGAVASSSPKKSNYVPWYDDPVKKQAYQKAKWTVIAQRAAPLVAIGLLINMTDQGKGLLHRFIFPLKLGQLHGPSMLPTIHPYGDTWLITTPLWDSVRQVYYKLKSLILGKPALMYSNGDIVVWKHPETNYYACKRIIGVEGDTVQRYGQFAEMYRHRSDYGVSWDVATKGIDPTCPWDQYNNNEADGSQQQQDDMFRTLVIPEEHVWLEGDNPLMSVDSRHYGPIPVYYLQGRLVWRLWPLVRHPIIRKHDQLLLRHRNIRPKPLDVETPKQRGQEDRLALYYNLHRRQKPQTEENEPPPPVEMNSEQ